MIKNIVFDLGNVILKGSPSIVLENTELTKEEIQNIKNKFFANWKELDLGNETLAEHLNKCGLENYINENVKEKILNYYKYRPFNNDIMELMNTLKNKNYNIFILSNNNKEAYKYLQKLPMFKSVDGWIVSCDYHMVKPNKEIYVKLFENFNVKPEECYFIDDKKENIETGIMLGMNGFRFDGEIQKLDELMDDMRKNNIELDLKFT